MAIEGGTRLACVLGGVVSLATDTHAGSEEELATQLANPIASLVSVPIELLYDEELGADGDGSQTALVGNPVIPFRISEDWNVISWTTTPFVSQSDIKPEPSSGGLVNVVQSLVLSPTQLMASGLIRGVEPVFQIPFDDVATAGDHPTATNGASV